MKRNLAIDSMRYIAALAIIALHVGYPGLPEAWGESVRLASRWAVPFFFIISGYFLHAPGKPLPERAMRLIVRLAMLLLVWSLLYTVVNILQYGVEYGLSVLVRGEVFLYGTYSHLWFLGSLLLGAVILAVIDTYRLAWLQAPLAVVILLLILVSDSYNLFGLALDIEVTRQLLSVPCMIAGGWLRSWKPHLLVAGLLAIGGFLLQFPEASWLLRVMEYPIYEQQFLIGTVLFSLGMAALAIGRLPWLERPRLAALGEHYSLGIYLLHRIIVLGWIRVGENAGWNWIYDGWWSAIFPLVVLAVTTLVLAGLREAWPALFGLLVGKRITIPAVPEG